MAVVVSVIAARLPDVDGVGNICIRGLVLGGAFPADDDDSPPQTFFCQT